MINHIKKLAIIEDASPDNIVVLSNISEGVDEASTFGYETEEAALTIEDGQTIHDAIEHTLDVRTIVPDSGDSQLQTWTDNLTSVYVSAIGVDGGILFGDVQTGEGAVRFYKDDQFSERKAIKIMATRKTIPGYDSSTGLFENGIWVGSNLLAGYEWADADSDGMADGWGNEGATFNVTTFTSGQQTLEAGTSVSRFVRRIYFPFEGEEVTFSLDNDSRTGTYATEEISIQFIDDSDAVISTETTTFSTTGRKSVTGTTPANTIKINVLFSIAASSTTVTSVISDPALQLGTKTTYTKE